MELLMAILTEGCFVIRSITTGLSAFQMMHMEFDVLSVCATALTGVMVSPKYVLAHIVVSQHFTFLVVFPGRDRFAFFDGFDQLKVKLCSFYNHLGDW